MLPITPVSGLMSLFCHSNKRNTKSMPLGSLKWTRHTALHSKHLAVALGPPSSQCYTQAAGGKRTTNKTQPKEKAHDYRQNVLK